MARRDDFERIRKNIKALAKQEGLKVSITSPYYSKLSVAVLAAPAEMLCTRDHMDVNQYYINESEELSRYGKEICEKINNIIKVEHWDESDLQSDYFHCAFYYSISVGKWDKPFVCTWEKMAA